LDVDVKVNLDWGRVKDPGVGSVWSFEVAVALEDSVSDDERAAKRLAKYFRSISSASS